ncbi:hypothetical protein U9M48_002812 [Paspalum notatum var. saurae]|uniref:Uncharacterized protein n=1 Tax=Paspalum notatum var. saurae TaxID=547442 RepID=A0AAQ3PRS0_PASNO
MAKATGLFFFLGALLCQLHGGDAQQFCPASDISFTVDKTGLFYDGQPEYRVTFQTQCPCPMVAVHVTCDGVDGSAAALDASKVEVDDGMCVLKQPVVPGTPFWFNYALAAPVNFRVFSGHSDCGVSDRSH